MSCWFVKLLLNQSAEVTFCKSAFLHQVLSVCDIPASSIECVCVRADHKKMGIMGRCMYE